MKVVVVVASARAVRAMAFANQSLQSYFFQNTFFGELIVFWHLNLDFSILLKVYNHFFFFAQAWTLLVIVAALPFMMMEMRRCLVARLR